MQHERGRQHTYVFANSSGNTAVLLTHNRLLCVTAGEPLDEKALRWWPMLTL